MQSADSCIAMGHKNNCAYFQQATRYNLNLILTLLNCMGHYCNKII